MTYRGRVRNGVIVLEDGTLPDGTPVAVMTIGAHTPHSEPLPAFGLWHDRVDMTDSAEAGGQLRRQLERRGELG